MKKGEVMEKKAPAKKAAPKKASVKAAPKTPAKATPKVAAKAAPKAAAKATPKAAPKAPAKAKAKTAPKATPKAPAKATVKVKAAPKAVAKAAVKVAPKEVPPVEKTRYSSEELQEFKELILGKIAKAEKDLELLQQAVAGSENDVNDTAPTFKTLEEGSNVLLKEENQKLAARQQKFIRDLRAALIRIENGTYGICQATGKLIPKERLMIVPHATMTVEAKEASKKRR